MKKVAFGVLAVAALATAFAFGNLHKGEVSSSNKQTVQQPQAIIWPVSGSSVQG